MVGINDLLIGSLIVIASSSLIKSKVSSIPSQKFVKVAPLYDQFYKAKRAINFEAIQDITSAQDKLQQIRSETLKQEKFKTDTQIDYLKTEKSRAGALFSQLAKIVEEGRRNRAFSPRVRGIIISRRGYDPVDPVKIELGIKAKADQEKITSFIKDLDQRIINLTTTYSSLEGI